MIDKKKKKKKKSVAVQTVGFNARKSDKDKKIMKLINEYADEFCEGMEPKIALAYFLKEELPGKIEELRAAKRAKAS